MHAHLNVNGIEARRAFLRAATSTMAVGIIGCASERATNGTKTETPHGAEDEGEVTPGEDLMQEHGVLERILLVYDEAVRRLEHNEALDWALVGDAASIVRRFVEEYHEKLEEQFVFPRLEAAKRETNLVAILRSQHQRGREVTEEILKFANASASSDLARALRSFNRMYRPHAAREETVLFPAFRSVVGRAAYSELGEQFEDQEHARFGEHGFEETVAQVAKLEVALSIADLASFTP
jgi:hemerythrin-like domain-containing protein